MKNLQTNKKTWMKSLQVGHMVWLCKEQCVAEVKKSFHYTFYDTDGMGRICIVREGLEEVETWITTFDGKGVDGKQLFALVPHEMEDEEERERNITEEERNEIIKKALEAEPSRHFKSSTCYIRSNPFID